MAQGGVPDMAKLAAAVQAAVDATGI
jgi:hypothetical protein